MASRQLAIPLTAAERCWAHAMELKAALQEGAEPRKRHHAMRRLAKAARHAGELASLAEACGATRTALEADAYAAGMAGLALMEQERDWDAALARLSRAQWGTPSCLCSRGMIDRASTPQVSALQRLAFSSQ